jgi:hypothetical protein
MKRSYLKELVILFALFLIATAVLSPATFSLASSLRTNRIDSTGASGLKYTKLDIPFNRSEILSNTDGQKASLLNFSIDYEPLAVYSFDTSYNETKSISIIENNGKKSPVVWLSQVSNGTTVTIDGRWQNFSKLGSTTSIMILVIDEFHTPGFWDNLMSTNRIEVGHVLIVMTILIATFVLAAIGLLLLIVADIDARMDKRKPKKKRLQNVSSSI